MFDFTNTIQPFKVILMTCYLLTDMSSQNSFPRTQPVAGHILLIVYQLKIYRFLPVLVATFDRDVRVITNITCIKLCALSTFHFVLCVC